MYRQNKTEQNILYIKKHVHGGQRRESETRFDVNIKCRHYWTVMSWMSSTVFNNQEWVASMSLCPLVVYRVLTASNAKYMWRKSQKQEVWQRDASKNIESDVFTALCLVLTPSCVSARVKVWWLNSRVRKSDWSHDRELRTLRQSGPVTDGVDIYIFTVYQC